jgi:hypothetical protein
MRLARAALHKIIIVLAQVPLLLAFATVGIFLLMAVAADRVQPNACWGNCWTYAGARWARLGGYLTLRRVKDIMIMNSIPVPHAIWQSALTGAVRMTYPVARKAAKWFPIHALLFKFEVWHDDSPNVADWTPSGPTPDAWRPTEPPRG